MASESAVSDLHAREAFGVAIAVAVRALVRQRDREAPHARSLDTKLHRAVPVRPPAITAGGIGDARRGQEQGCDYGQYCGPAACPPAGGGCCSGQQLAT